ncbi:MAG: carboxymuconolactone decarboxylase family protein [Fusobacteriaceae bacterium]|nr:carboxymuconolactone decarboxylase family protein [Fusobacteriaceae bacterium]MBN2837212.1 carboxymuconolactone decarboxylase family protein [Fusobacteriaceae bacterium]
MNNRYSNGIQKLKEVDGNGGIDVIESLKDISPDLGKYIIEFAFGDIYSRKFLDLKQRETITLASLLTQGACEPQLKVHIKGALNVGLKKEEIIEIFIQCIPYVGFPKVLNATFAAKEIFLQL